MQAQDGALLRGASLDFFEGGLTVGPKDTVEISGEIDRDLKKVKLDVFKIRKVSPTEQ